MTVRAGREFLAIPGPTTVPDEVLRAMHRPAVDIYSGSLVQLTDSLLTDLSRVFRTEGRSYVYIANGHGAWEAALTNVLSKGDRILVLESGRFAAGWGDAAAGLGVEVEALQHEFRRLEHVHADAISGQPGDAILGHTHSCHAFGPRRQPPGPRRSRRPARLFSGTAIYNGDRRLASVEPVR